MLGVPAARMRTQAYDASIIVTRRTRTRGYKMEVPWDSGARGFLETVEEGRSDNQESLEGGLTWCTVPSAVLASRLVGPKPSRIQGDARPDAGGDAFRRLSTSHLATSTHKQIPDNGHAPSLSTSTIYSKESPRNSGNGLANFDPDRRQPAQQFHENAGKRIRAYG
ncbi:uncharacterized protein LOC122537907 [Frieseomelitta varia]|uniref:uncharacterized protein LOC122537907 n=1 Tax=Frieseomelitta varia TaxID=561572 RepID=UPI001CB694A2|nr:uncharacterized protein LOC122537907 [Frieseomelitta varia]